LKKRFAILVLLSALFLSASCAARETAGNLAPANRTERSDGDLAVFDTSKGIFKVKLFQQDVPLTASNFIALAKRGFYNGLIFHRAIDGFMIQGGDPNGNGTGGPGYVIKDEFSPRLKHDKPGMLSMANAGPDTGGSQFFITLAPAPWLDGKHSVFGQIVEGMDVVAAIGKVKTDARDKPLENVVIKKITIEEDTK
jgi:peptidyl-prolyl cis-trans isomerase A (cyclophilin A)